MLAEMVRARTLNKRLIAAAALALLLGGPAAGAAPEDVACPRGTAPEPTGWTEMPYLCAPVPARELLPAASSATVGRTPAEAPACGELAARVREVGRRLRREGAGLERLRSRIRLVSSQADRVPDRQLADELGRQAAEMRRMEAAKLVRLAALQKAYGLLGRSRAGASCPGSPRTPATGAAGR